MVHHSEHVVKTYQAPTVKKAFLILWALSESRNGMRMSELSKKLSIGKSTVLGILNALSDLGAVIKDPGKKSYSLGVTLFELGKAAHSRFDLKEVARPILQDLMERAQESVFLGVRNGEHVTIVDTVESTQDLKITAPVGTRIPLFAGAVGKVFTASLPDAEVAKLIQFKGIPPFTKNTITNPLRFMKVIREVRKNGYAIDDEEYISGVRAVATPVESLGNPNWAIWIVGFKPRMDSEKMAFLAREIRNAADSIRREKEKADAFQTPG